MAVVSVEDVAKGMGRPVDELNEGQVAQAIEDAETLLRIKLGDLTSLDQVVLKLVVRLAVTDYVQNPEGAAEESWSMDDASHTVKRGGTSGGRVAILPEWLEWLRPPSSGGSFSIAPG